jgi:hypothetical protein
MGRLLTGNVDGVMNYIHSVAAGHDYNPSQTELASLLRLSTHILLVMRDLEIAHNLHASNEIITEYVHALMEFKVVSQSALTLLISGRPNRSLRISFTDSTRH